MVVVAMLPSASSVKKAEWGEQSTCTSTGTGTQFWL